MNDLDMTIAPRPADDETWRWCRDCARLTGGRCARHSIVVYLPTVTYVYPPVLVTYEIFVPVGGIIK